MAGGWLQRETSWIGISQATGEAQEARADFNLSFVTRIEWLSATEGAGRDRAWHEAFRIGAAEVIVARLRESAGGEREALGTHALAVVEPALAARAAAVARFAETHLRLKPGRGLRVDARGLARGRAAGAQAPLPPGRAGG